MHIRMENGCFYSGITVGARSPTPGWATVLMHRRVCCVCSTWTHCTQDAPAALRAAVQGYEERRLDFLAYKMERHDGGGKQRLLERLHCACGGWPHPSCWLVLCSTCCKALPKQAGCCPAGAH